MSKRDKAGNTAQAAKGKARREPAARLRGRGKKKADLKQAGEKLKVTARN